MHDADYPPAPNDSIARQLAAQGRVFEWDGKETTMPNGVKYVTYGIGKPRPGDVVVIVRAKMDLRGRWLTPAIVRPRRCRRSPAVRRAPGAPTTRASGSSHASPAQARAPDDDRPRCAEPGCGRLLDPKQVARKNGSLYCRDHQKSRAEHARRERQKLTAAAAVDAALADDALVDRVLVEVAVEAVQDGELDLFDHVSLDAAKAREQLRREVQRRGGLPAGLRQRLLAAAQEAA